MKRNIFDQGKKKGMCMPLFFFLPFSHDLGMRGVLEWEKSCYKQNVKLRRKTIQ